MIYQLFRKPTSYPKNYKPCGRVYCYCVKTMKLNNKKEKKIYEECYRMWYNYFHM